MERKTDGIGMLRIASYIVNRSVSGRVPTIERTNGLVSKDA